MKRSIRFSVLALVLFLCLVSYGLVPSVALGAVPQLINFQGILKDGSGNPVANGSYSVTFTIYDASTGGNNLWTETQSVSTSGGLFAVLLGSTNPIPDTAFKSQNRWLGIAVSPDPEMPRQQLVSVSYAFRVNSVDSALGGVITSKVSIGPGHTNSGTNAFVAGENNKAGGNYSAVSGGGGPAAADSNAANGDWSGIHGGTGNTATGLRAFIGGGYHNTSSASDATVGGGFINTAGGPGATVAGGGYNTASGFDATVGGGDSHVASGNFATVAGGWRDTANAIYATVSGGWGNNANDSAATVGGGRSNRAGGRYAIVGGGMGNTANGYGASVSGGISNSAPSLWSTVGGGIYDTAFGAYANVAGGGYNIANGSAATVGGGVNNKALVGNSTIGGGTGNSANGGAATVSGGQFNQATAGFATVAGGGGNTVSGNSSTIGGGTNNTVSGGVSTIGGGYLNVASGNYSTIGGGETDTVQGYNATVPGGRYNKASGDYSFAAGYRAKALHNGTFVWADEPGVFGTDFASTGINQFLIRAAGGVGINTNDPNEALTIGGSMEVGTGAGDYQHLRIGGGNSSGFLYGSYPKYGDGIHIGYNYYASAGGFNVIPNLGGATSRLSLGYGYIGMFVGGVSGEPATLGVYVNSLGNVGVGTGAPAYRLDVAGSAHATSFPTSSDIRLKKNIEPLTNVLEKIEKIRGVSFDWNETYEKLGRSSGHREIGVIAQDVEAVFPELVSQWGNEHYRGVDYGRMTAVLIEAVKELKAENEELRNRISKLEKGKPQAKIEE